MRSKTELGRRAVREATRLRARFGIEPTSSVCPLDLAIDLGIVVWLHALPSLEGMYSSGSKPAVLLSTERPWGRIRHTCGHEVGHYVFGHGARVDELEKDEQRGWNPEEFIADRFATGLQMPKLTVLAAVQRRGWSAARLNPEQVFVLAQEFGVSYLNLVSHLERTLKVTSSQTAEGLRRSGRKLQWLRCAVAGFDVPHDVFVGNEYWCARSIDIETGDIIVVPADALFSGHCARAVREPKPHLLGIAAGEGKLKLRTRRSPVQVRVSRRGFTGLARYRHMDEPDGE